MGLTHPDRAETRHPAEEYRWAVEGMDRAGEERVASMDRAGEERVASMDRPELGGRPGRGDQLI